MPIGSGVVRGAAVGVVALVAAATALIAVTTGPVVAQDSEEPTVRPVRLTWAEPDEILAPPIVGRLEPATVLEVWAVGYPSDTTGRVRQCFTATERRCRNSLAVRTDDRGTAVFQYLVTDAVDPEGGCRLDSPGRCTIELTIGDRLTAVDTVFVDAAPRPGRLTIDPDADLEIGETVTLTATGFPPRSELLVQVCATPATSGDRCGSPGPEVTIVADAEGAAGAMLTLDVDAVGRDGVACGRRTACQIVAAGPSVGVWASPVRLDFATASGPAYDGSRLTVGLLVAALLAAVAARLIHATDWRPPAEADSSAIDNAAWADLDAEADAFEEAEIR